MTRAHRWPVLATFCMLLVAPNSQAEDEDAWPYTPVRRPAIPVSVNRALGRNPVDAMILQSLQTHSLTLAPEADRLTLLKRVTYDLTGLPPTPEQVAEFLGDDRPDAYERLVDRLLASPHFGERWAQHWLDVVRYAETEGFKLDRYRPEAYRYRDYVIQSFNDDLPYNRFIQQQLAGDELEPDNPNALVATGFYRLHPEESNGSDYRQIRQDILNDITDVVGTTFMGLTVGCARCHDHKFDPFSQNDYFEMQAFFAPLVHRDDVPLAERGMVDRYQKGMRDWESMTEPIRREMERMLEPIRRELFQEIVVTLDPVTQEALRTPVGERTAMQIQLAILGGKQIERRFGRMHRRLPADQRAKYEELQAKLTSFDRMKPQPLPMGIAVADVGLRPPPTHRLLAGNYLKPREEVQPDFPECVDIPEPRIQPPSQRPSSTGRRAALALWLSHPDHPLTARVIVNRLWQHYFGMGIVPTPNDFGEMGGKPTHPELLDFLASELVRNDWRLKHIHRMIVLSSTYRQGRALQRAQADPENRLLWQARVRRRDGEAIRDAVLLASGRLEPRMFGVSALPELPAALSEDRYAWYADQNEADRRRRSIYVYQRRNLTYPLFAVFDAPDRNSSCPARQPTVTAPQALAMLNGEFTHTESHHLAQSLLADSREPQKIIRAAYQRILIRTPNAIDQQRAADFLTHQTLRIRNESQTSEDAAFDAAVVDLCHALLNSAEFLFIE